MNRRGAQLQVPYHWKLQPLATVDAAGVQNTWYTVLDTTYNVRLHSILVKQANNLNVQKTMQVRATIDGVASGDINISLADANTTYYVYMLPTSDQFWGTIVAHSAGYYAALHGRSVKVEARITSAADPPQHLYGYVRYATLEVAPS